MAKNIYSKIGNFSKIMPNSNLAPYDVANLSKLMATENAISVRINWQLVCEYSLHTNNMRTYQKSFFDGDKIR